VLVLVAAEKQPLLWMFSTLEIEPDEVLQQVEFLVE
jgi:hypothetical protein